MILSQLYEVWTVTVAQCLLYTGIQGNRTCSKFTKFLLESCGFDLVHLGKSTYLYHTTNPLTSRIARLRHNRVFTQVARSRFEDKLISPDCTWPPCRASIPVPTDSVVHILTQCGRHSLSRKLLLKELHNIDPRRYPSVSHTCLLTVLGEIYPRSSFSLSILPKCQRIFRALADFFYHITLDRGGDGGASLRLF